MEIIRDGITNTKEDGTIVTYYIFPEYEIHYNKMPPGVEQKWHYHDAIEETIYIIDGEIDILWKENNQFNNQKVVPGNIVRVEKTLHTIKNSSQYNAKFIVFRMILSGTDKRDVIKKDKHIINNKNT
ncbi:MAG: cupin domain-containing protein [Bacteroidales bacterium]|nr:cupin domain-containing protein [Bacteroidales bacterium]